MYYKFCLLFLNFIIFSVLGYIAEVSTIALNSKKLVLSRGFLIGPYLPIYGAGSIIMIFSLTKYQNDLLALFVMGAFICTVLEYFTSYILEKIFKLRWWDYSTKKYNINGRVCLENAFLFGIGGVFVIKLIYPLIKKFLNLFSPTIIMILATLILIAFITDLVLSIFILIRLEINVSKYINVDATAKIKHEVKLSLEKYTALTMRLLKSFPNIQSENNKAFQTFKRLISKTRYEVQKLKQEARVLEQEAEKIETDVKNKIKKEL